MGGVRTGNFRGSSANNSQASSVIAKENENREVSRQVQKGSECEG